MATYRIKNPDIEAIQYTGKNGKECEEFLHGCYDNTLSYPNITAHGKTFRVDVGQYIWRYKKGDYYTCEKEFIETFYKKEIDSKLLRNNMIEAQKAMEISANYSEVKATVERISALIETAAVKGLVSITLEESLYFSDAAIRVLQNNGYEVKEYPHTHCGEGKATMTIRISW